MKKKKDPFEDLFKEFFEDFDLESLPSISGGYSISITSSGGKTLIHVKADKNVDVSKLRKELESQYPGAEIIIEGGKIQIEEGKEEKGISRKPLIEVIEEKKISEEENN